MGYDFSGYATKNDLLCSDGRTIRKDAFKENDGKIVPLVWNHNHDDPANVLGHALLENRSDGVYAYGTFNDTEAGQNAKSLVKHGDVTAMSIYANKLKQKGGNVIHGVIREVSLVLGGANPGAVIDNPIIAHSGEENLEEAIISLPDDECSLTHSDITSEAQSKDDSANEKTVQDVFDEFTEEQKNVVYFLIGQALEDADSEDQEDNIEHSEGDNNMANEKTVQDVFDELTEEQKNVVYFLIGQALEDAGVKEEGEGEDMKQNVFADDNYSDTLSHSDMEGIFSDAKRCGSLREAITNFFDGDEDLIHDAFNGNAIAHSITNIDYLYPDAKTVGEYPTFINRNQEWVTSVMHGVHHTPFSRIKSIHADLTEDDARAKGYIKGKLKKEQVFELLKRTTTPTTIYKKQKLDRDDVIDITDFDVVSFIKSEMRMMLDEEIARAILVGDGRSGSSDDHINPLNVRPIWTDDDLYTIKKQMEFAATATEDDKAREFIRQVIKARKDYKGSGNPVLYTTEDMLTAMLLLEDGVGRSLYKDEAEIATKLRVKEIITVPVMENLSREVSGKDYDLLGIVVNLNDYNVGADKGGAVNMFDDFDIDYNAQKYLIETRCSGALTVPYSAIVLEATTASAAKVSTNKQS